MKNPLAGAKPVARLARKTKAAFASWLKEHDPARRAFYLRLAKDRVFDNLVAAFCLFWAAGDKNALADAVDAKALRAARPPADSGLFEVLREAVAFSAQIKGVSESDYAPVRGQCAQKAQALARALTSLFARWERKGQEELKAFTRCFEALLAFNFIDLYTFKIQVAGADAEFARYGALADLIVKQSELLEASYAPFRAAAAPAFNLLFRTVLTLRKRLV